MEDFPNVVIIPENSETPEEIVEDYASIIMYNLDRGVPIEEILYDFFDDVNQWSCKQFLIDTAKQNLFELENIHKIQNNGIEIEDDENNN